jgi:hypothetical protein
MKSGNMTKSMPKTTPKWLILLIFGFLLPFKQIGGDENEKIYRNGMMAVRNIFQTQDAVRSRVEDLEYQEQLIKKEKEKAQLLERSFQGMFPNGRRSENQTNCLLRQLKDINPNDPANKHLFEEKKSKSGVGKGILIGGAIALVGVALGVLVGMNLKKSKKCEAADDSGFARFITGYINDHSVETA